LTEKSKPSDPPEDRPVSNPEIEDFFQRLRKNLPRLAPIKEVRRVPAQAAAGCCPWARASVYGADCQKKLVQPAPRKLSLAHNITFTTTTTT
jgi:hypothetical protein